MCHTLLLRERKSGEELRQITGCDLQFWCGEKGGFGDGDWCEVWIPDHYGVLEVVMNLGVGG